MKRIIRIMFAFIVAIAGILAFEWMSYSFTGTNSQIQLFDKPQLMAVIGIVSVFIALCIVTIFAIIYTIVHQKPPATKTVAKLLAHVSFFMWTIFYAIRVLLETLTNESIWSGSDFIILWATMFYGMLMILSLYLWSELFPEIEECISLEAVTPSGIDNCKN